MTIRIPAAFTLVLGLVAAAPPPVSAQAPVPSVPSVVCGEHDVVVAQLAESFGEVRQGLGVAKPDAVFELFASEETGTWSILRTGIDGISCIMVAGTGWEVHANPIQPAGNPA